MNNYNNELNHTLYALDFIFQVQFLVSLRLYTHFILCNSKYLLGTNSPTENVM